MIQNQELKETTTLEQIIEMLQNPNFTLIVSIDGNCTTESEPLKTLFDALGISRNGESGFWCINYPDGIYYFSGTEETDKYISFNCHDFHLIRVFDESRKIYVNTVVIDNVVEENVVNGVNLYVYDNVTQSLIDSFGFDKDVAYQLVRKKSNNQNGAW